MTVQKAFAAIILLSLLFITALHGAESILKKSFVKKSEPASKTLLFADEVINDEKNEILTAKGNVEITRDHKTIYADIVTYNQKTDVVIAIGHVRLHDEDGNIIFSSYAELTGDLKEAFAKEVRAILSDQSLLAANQSRRIEDTKNQLEQAIYSPCKLCTKDPMKAPLWQIKSRHVVLDEETEDVTHTDASMEFFGVPFLYTPYLRHPGPTVKRRSGILAPVYGGSKDLGAIIGVPYYWNISQDKDLTVTPVYTRINPLLIMSYRQRFCHGKFRFDFSITEGVLKEGPIGNQTNKRSVRGHVDTEGLFDLTKNWRAGFDLKRSLDETYFRKYKILGYVNESFLTSRLFAERFTERNYAVVESLSFQGLRLGDSDSHTPFIAPSADIHIVKGPSLLGGTFYIDANALNLLRDHGTKMQRFSGTSTWRRHSIFDHGSVLELGASLRQDLYHIEDFKFSPTSSSKYTGDQGRFFPQLYADLKYPLVNFIERARLILEPVIGLVVARPHIEKHKIPNEDSKLFEFNDANLFSPIRFPGLDRVDPGSRVNWGLRAALFSTELTNSEIFVGQSYSFKRPEELFADSGLDNHLSDYVARARLNYTSWLTLEGRFLIDRKDFSARRNESSIRIGQPIFQASATYSRLPKVSTPNLASEQIMLTLSSQVTETWSTTVQMTRELGKKGGQLSQGVGITYTDECFTFQATATKTFYEDRDVKPGLIVLFRLVFKNLGDFAFTSDQLGLTSREVAPETY